jgi:hypothetical protein
VAHPFGFTTLYTFKPVLATKKIDIDPVSGAIVTSGYDKAKFFRVRPATFTDIGDLFSKLLVLERDPHAFIVRGEPLPGIDMDRSRRLTDPDFDSLGKITAPATFAKADRQWVMLDIDLRSFPGIPDDLLGGILFLLRFALGTDNVDFIYSLSSSYGITSSLHVHVFVLLDRPYSGDELKLWAGEVNDRGKEAGAVGKVVDPALFNGVQAHYTAAPVFGKGVVDPVTDGRTKLVVRGERFATLAIPRTRKALGSCSSGDYKAFVGFDGYLSRIGDKDGFHGHIMSAIASYVGKWGADVSGLRPILQQAILEADPGGRNEDVIARYASDAFLDDKIQWAIKHEMGKAGGSLRLVRDEDDEPEEPILVPTVKVINGELPRVVDEAEAALAGSGIYQRSSGLVRLVRSARNTVKSVFSREEQSLVMAGVDQAALVEELTRRARFVKWSERKKRASKCDAPPLIAATLLSRLGRWSEAHIPPIVGVVCAPVIRANGTVLVEDGYDPETYLYLDSGGVEWPEINPRPTRADAEDALDRIMEIFAEFPFEEGSDTSTAVAALMTGVLRKSIQQAPLTGYRAPKPRSGKTVLADSVGLVATGKRPATMTYRGDMAEDSKAYMALLLAGDPVINIDNLSVPLGDDALNTIMTQPVWTGRLLGKNDASARLSVSTCATFLATGNNLVVRADMATRTLVCRIDPKVEHPEERRFSMDLYDEIPRRRAQLVADVLALVLAYRAAGGPATGRSLWGGFDDWCRWVRDPLVWLGMTDPCDGRKHVEASDPVHQELVALFNAWYPIFLGKAATVADLVKVSQMPGPANSLLRESIQQIAGTPQGDINARRFGNFLGTHASRIEGGFRLAKSGERQGVATWSIEHVA